MAAATLGRIDEFDPSKEEWPQYVERLEHFFIVNDIKTAKNKASRVLICCQASNIQIPPQFAFSGETRRQQ